MSETSKIYKRKATWQNFVSLSFINFSSEEMDKKRKYRITEVKQAKSVAGDFLQSIQLDKAIDFGLPEIDDRYHIWRVPLLSKSKEAIGEVVIDAVTTFVNEKKTTSKEVLESRLLGRKSINGHKEKRSTNGSSDAPKISSIRNTVGLGDSEELLIEMPAESVDLVFTSPPYYNARPEYADYLSYEEYLLKIKKIIHQCHRVLNEGRFFVMNVSPVLVRRANRNESSKRIAVPFDMHRLFIEEGFEFVDDIHWVKPEGAGWATGRGRRFAADRNPLQYKPVPVTEYILVYRKATDKLIDWHIRKHPHPEVVESSKIEDGYETTNLWKIHPAYHSKHPAVFPMELAEKVIKYYSFKNDVVLDPFAGSGTVGKAAVKTDRRFVLFEQDAEYMNIIKDEIHQWLHNKAEDVNWINTGPADNKTPYFNF
ncbi:MAG TPA: site-specific DNA-methyltransferase [Saprospiraceae bacterium]|jgi:DNA modification methylase|nr:site-specific DNA-methyltransferase [Saprospiraceae bacterium]HRF37433.1 site-specific DNA-methyltransferase [Saprospiraceae bacterium]HRK82772.1 site-specific DNA-methyltransferase [Saprospiraceae bacterium]